MTNRPLIPATPGTKQGNDTSQKARTEALRQADLQRTRKRLDSDSHIDVHAAKWRYVSSGE
ncbi:hypothetical protein AWB74_08169 [Caballeronia arvi]|uniref:Uncharacterized protein n=1 Tax=Caballeronia arvi TaxID=1777135 RepID=A0A158L2E1_9BURK|nr:hypothetical protein AWB74_08169 [Caballeronia arvi]